MSLKPFLLAALLLPPIAGHAAPADTDPDQAAGRLAGWSGGRAEILSRGPEGRLVVGEVAADGTVQLSLPALPSPVPGDGEGQTLGAVFPACDEAGTAIATPADVALTPTSLTLSRDGEELGALHLVSSPALMAWRASFGQGTAVEGAWGQWVHVPAAAALEGRCEAPMFSDPEGEDAYTLRTTYHAALAPGWNLLRQRITALHAARDGRAVPEAIVVDALPSQPEGLHWMFEAY